MTESVISSDRSSSMQLPIYNGTLKTYVLIEDRDMFVFQLFNSFIQPQILVCASAMFSYVQSDITLTVPLFSIKF